MAMPRGLPRSEETIALRNANLQGGTIDEQSQELTPEPKSRESWRRLHFGHLIFPSTMSAVDEMPRPLQRSPRQYKARASATRKSHFLPFTFLSVTKWKTLATGPLRRNILIPVFAKKKAPRKDVQQQSPQPPEGNVGTKDQF